MSSPNVSTITRMAQNGPSRSEVGQKQVTVALGGLYAASTTSNAKPLLVWESEGGSPLCYIPVESLHNDLKSKINGGGDTGTSTSVETLETVKGVDGQPQALIEKVTFGTKCTTWVRFVEGKLKGFVRFEPNDVDDWFENGALFTPGENPHKRGPHGMFHRKHIETKTERHDFVVRIDGEEVAESKVAVLLKQTGLKPAYYFPATSIKHWGSVEKSNLHTGCPYKGEASYLSITVNGKKYKDMIWYYPHAKHEGESLEGMICFYQKPNVEILVDGKHFE